MYQMRSVTFFRISPAYANIIILWLLQVMSNTSPRLLAHIVWSRHQQNSAVRVTIPAVLFQTFHPIKESGT